MISDRARGRIVPVFLILAIAVTAVGVGLWILTNQRLRLPFVEPRPFILHAEFSTAQAVTPGQGQTVRVSGVRVGDVSEVELREGRAIVTMALDPAYAGIVRRDARALLRPKTGLKDMFVELTPGTPSAPPVDESFTVPVASTLPDVNPDEILSMLDADTRDYLRLLVAGGARGLEGRSDELREVFRRFEPTHRDLAAVTGAVAARRSELRRLVTSLADLGTALAERDDDLAGLVQGAAATFRTLADADADITASLGRMPAVLRETRRALGHVRTFATALRPTAEALRPAARRLDEANEALTPLAREATPLLREAIRPLVRETRPLARTARPAVETLGRSTAPLKRTGAKVNRLLNMLAANPRGREAPGRADRDEGMLFWTAWLGHVGGALLSTGDAHGVLRPLAEMAPCSILKMTAEQLGGGDPLAGTLIGGLEGVFTDPRVCGRVLETGDAFARRVGGTEGR